MAAGGQIAPRGAASEMSKGPKSPAAPRDESCKDRPARWGGRGGWIDAPGVPRGGFLASARIAGCLSLVEPEFRRLSRERAATLAGLACCNLETSGAYIRKHVFRISSAANENAARQT